MVKPWDMALRAIKRYALRRIAILSLLNPRPSGVRTLHHGLSGLRTHGPSALRTYTTLKSRRTSFREVFRSVLALR